MVVADHHGPVVVLHGSGEDLGGRRADPGGEDDQGSAEDHAALRVVQHALPGVGALDGHDAALADEESGDGDGVLQQASAVAREVEEQAVDRVVVQSAVQQVVAFLAHKDIPPQATCPAPLPPLVWPSPS